MSAQPGAGGVGQQAAVQTDAMRQAHASFEAAHGLNDDIRTTVDGQRQNVAASWEGESSQVFQQAMVSWDTHFQGIQQELMQMMEVLAVNTRQYDEADTAGQDASTTLADEVNAGPAAGA